MIAFGGMLAIEGAVWAVFPAQMRRMYEEAFTAGDKILHFSGLFSVAIGVLMIMWAVKPVSYTHLTLPTILLV